MEYNEEEIRTFMTLGWPEYCSNPHMLKWWTPLHDELMANRVERLRWHWYDPFLDAKPLEDELLSITPPNVIDSWIAEDPFCSWFGSRRALWVFAVSRATEIGLIRAIKEPYKKICPLCDGSFFVRSVSASFVVWLGIDHIDYCENCLSQAVDSYSGDDELSREQTLISLQELAKLLQRVPFGRLSRGRQN